MNIKTKKNWLKRTVVCMAATAVLISGMIVSPMKADAAEGILYDDTLSMSDYWGEKKAPVKDGYVFGGWYQEVGGVKKALTETEAATFNGKAYAKFVPAYVLSVKAQIQSGAEIGNAEKTYLRLVTSVDSTDYQNISFDVWINNKVKLSEVPVIKKVYTDITTSEGKISAKEAFGNLSQNLATLKLTEIAKDNYRKIIYVRPYWTTLDGTKVEGLAKYIRVEDGFVANKYLSVPINLLEQQEVAAGTVELSYKAYKDQIEVAKDSSGNYLIDAGRVLPSMEYYVDEANGIIRFVGNAAVNEYKTGEVLYANVRFRVKDGARVSDSLLFTMQAGQFCNWDEQSKAVNAWDYQY